MTAMDAPPPPAPHAADESVARLPKGVLVVAVLLIAALAGYLLFGKSIRWSLWMKDVADKETRRKLVDESDPALVDKLDGALRDADLPRVTRVALAGVLIEKNKLSVVEKAAEDPSLDVRTVAFESLARQSFFRKQYADDPHYRFHETALAWIKDASRTDRVSALAVLPQLYGYEGKLPDDVRDALRAVATPATKDSTLRYTAAMSLAGYRDCGAAPGIAELALAEQAPDAKLRLMQVVVQFFDAGGEECARAVPEDRVREVVARGLAHQGGTDDLNRAVRIGALGILARHPAWAKTLAEPIRALIESNAHEVERRSALEAIVASGDPAAIARLPAYFHDVTPGVRSSAAGIARQAKSEGRLGLSLAALNSLLVGYVSEETEGRLYEASLRLSYAEIRQRAGAWVGLPEPFRSRGTALTSDVSSMLHTLFTTGVFEGTTRVQVADGLFRWLAGEQKLSDADVEAAVRAHADFWTKARAGDVAAAKAVYDAVSPQKPDLWTYEKGWLLAKRAL